MADKLFRLITRIIVPVAIAGHLDAVLVGVESSFISVRFPSAPIYVRTHAAAVSPSPDWMPEQRKCRHIFRCVRQDTGLVASLTHSHTNTSRWPTLRPGHAFSCGLSFSPIQYPLLSAWPSAAPASAIAWIFSWSSEERMVARSIPCCWQCARASSHGLLCATFT